MDRGRPEKLTSELKNLITKIKTREPKRTAKSIREDVRLHLISQKREQNPQLLDKEIKRIVDNEELPGESAITKFLTPIVKQLKIPSLLDQSWSIGSCIEYDIPADMIPALIQIQQFAQKLGVKITTRQARWFARLYPTVQKMMTKKQHTNIAGVLIQFAIFRHVKLDREASNFLVKLFKFLESAKELSNQSEKEQLNQLVGLVWLALIGVQYARQEQVSELIGQLGKREFDTAALDNLYFIREDFLAEALLDGFWDTYATPEGKKRRADYLANFKGLSAMELEADFGKQLIQNQIDMANDFSRAMLHSAVRGREWIEQHSEQWAELFKLWEEKEHERTHN